MSRVRYPRPDYRIKRWQRLRATVYGRDEFSCVNCGWSPPAVPVTYDGRLNVPHVHLGEGRTRQLEIDHVVSLASGGTNALENFQTLCFDCNMRKGARA